jgi:hypothetical protein
LQKDLARLQKDFGLQIIPYESIIEYHCDVNQEKCRVMIDDNFLRKLEELAKKVDTLMEALENNPKYQSEWIGKERTMRILECSERTLQYLRDNGKLHFTNPLGGSKYFYCRKEVMSLFENNFNGKY